MIVSLNIHNPHKNVIECACSWEGRYFSKVSMRALYQACNMTYAIYLKLSISEKNVLMLCTNILVFNQ